MGKVVMTVKNGDVVSFIIMFLLTTYSFTSGGIVNYVFHNLLFILITFIIIIIGTLSFTSFKVRCSKVLAIQIMFCIVIILTNRNANFIHGVFVNDIAIITAFLFLLFSNHSNIWHKYFILFTCIWTFFHASITVLEYVVPGLYLNQIFPLFVDTAYAEYLLSGFNMGIMPGITANPTSNGMYLSVGIIIVSLIYLFQGRKKKVILSLLVLITIALLFTRKRALIVFSPLSVFIVYYIYNSDEPIKRIIKIIGMIFAVLAIFINLNQYLPLLDGFIDRFIETRNSGDISVGRFMLYGIAFLLFLDNPLTGIGWDAFKYYYLLNYFEFKNTHNVYLQLLTENGVIGALPFFIFFLVCYARAIRTMVNYCKIKKRFRNHMVDYGLAFSVGMQTLFLLYSMTENPLYDAQIFFPYICCISIGEYYIAQMKQHKDEIIK